MDKLIELLQQIQDLAGVAVEALQGAGKGQRPEGKPEHAAPGGPPHGEPDRDERAGQEPPGPEEKRPPAA